MNEIALAVALALVIGLSLGALGSGGSIVTMPVLVYVAGIPPKTAVGMSLAIVGATSFVASYLHYRRGNFHLKAALLFCISGVAGAYFGSMFTHLVPSFALMLGFAVLMLLIGALMLRRQTLAGGSGKCVVLRCLLVGLFVGGLTGFLGVGGGFLIVPALVFISGLDTKKAVGTSLAIIAFNSVSGLVGQLRYVQIDWQLTFFFLAASLIGMAVGLSIVRRVPEQALRTAFAISLLIIGSVIGLKNL